MHTRATLGRQRVSMRKPWHSTQDSPATEPMRSARGTRGEGHERAVYRPLVRSGAEHCITAPPSPPAVSLDAIFVGHVGQPVHTLLSAVQAPNARGAASWVLQLALGSGAGWLGLFPLFRLTELTDSSYAPRARLRLLNARIFTAAGRWRALSTCFLA
jgi:hypothetical protein